MVNKGPFMEFLNATLTMPAANTYHQIDIPTPCAKSEELAMLVHMIEIRQSAPDLPTVQGDWIQNQVTKTNQATMLNIDNNESLFFKDSLSLGISTETRVEPTRITFSPPMLISTQKLYFAMQSAGMAAGKNAQVRIGYTLEKVDKDAYIDALVS